MRCVPLELTVRAGHPEFLDLPWDRSIVDWDVPHMVDLPKGISRHEVRFFQYGEGVYAIKELPTRPARRDYTVLRTLESSDSPAVRPVGLVEGRSGDPTEERSAALITAYEPFSFSYRQLVAGTGFGPRRRQMLDAFAELLVELHLAGVFWGDCSLSNVLYRYDAEAIETVMVDAETAEVYQGGGLSDGRRQEDLEIMVMNVAGGMADIAASQGVDADEADLALGDDIAARYHSLWTELNAADVVPPDETYRIRQRIERLNDLGFQVTEIDLVPVDETGSRLRLTPKVGGRRFHTTRLKELTGIEALEQQAKQILSDLYYFQATAGTTTATGKNVAAIQWRVHRFEPMMERMRSIEGVVDPIQAYCDLLHHRFVMSEGIGSDVGNDAALEDWIARGRPGYPLGSS